MTINAVAYIHTDVLFRISQGQKSEKNFKGSKMLAMLPTPF